MNGQMNRPNAPIDNIRHVRCVDVIYHPKKGIYCESYCEVGRVLIWIISESKAKNHTALLYKW